MRNPAHEPGRPPSEAFDRGRWAPMACGLPKRKRGTATRGGSPGRQSEPQAWPNPGSAATTGTHPAAKDRALSSATIPTLPGGMPLLREVF